MAEIYFEVEDYLWFNEYQQGNVNVGGLVFDDIIEESFDLGHEAYTVWMDQVDETLDFAEGDFKGIHWPFISDVITLRELSGSPMRVRQSVVNLVMTAPLVPALIAHVHLDVLHGVDIYREEVSSELQAHSSYANAVPYYWEWLYESLDIDMTEPQPNPPLYLELNMLSTDLLNMRHEVVQDYLFNSICIEEFFVWESTVWGWGHRVAESLVDTDSIREIIGKVADEHLYLQDGPVPKVKVVQIMDERFFGFDAVDGETYWGFYVDESGGLQEEVEEAIGLGDNSAGHTGNTLRDGISLGGVALGNIAFPRLAVESIVFTDMAALLQEFLVEEGLEMGDVALAQWVFNVLAESGFDVADIIG